MQLIELLISRSDAQIRKIVFKAGLNLIIDAPSGAPTSTGNSIGKTTVLRLVDYCLGSDGNDIWEDAEFKTVNVEVYEFLHGTVPVTVTLTMANSKKTIHRLERTFTQGKKRKDAYLIDRVSYKGIEDYRAAVKQLVFGASGARPTLRQLMPKFVRSSSMKMSKTLKFLGDYGSAVEYEAVHLFLFGFLSVGTLEQRSELTREHARIDRDILTLTRMRKEGEIEQLLLHLRREIEQISLSSELRGEVPEIAERATGITQTRAEAARVANSLSELDSEIASLQTAIEEFTGDFGDVDTHAVEAIYQEAQNYIPNLQRDWVDLADFVKSLRARKQRFLESQIATLQERAKALAQELSGFQQSEAAQIDGLVESPEFLKALELRGDLQEKLKQLGSLEQNLLDIKSLRSSLAGVELLLDQTRQRIEEGKALLQANVAIFNKYFSKLSATLYGEQYLLSFEENDKGTHIFQLTAVGMNVGSGKKASQTAAFDFAYISFLKETKLEFPRFVCHDGIESVHGNQLSTLLSTADALDGQLILSTLRDKLPQMPKGFIERNIVLELSQQDKLFRI